MATLKAKVKQIGAWIAGGLFAGLVVVGTLIQNKTTEIALTERQLDSLIAWKDSVDQVKADSAQLVMDSLDLISVHEILIWDGADNSANGGYEPGQCVQLLPIRTARKSIEIINPKFQIRRIMAKSRADVWRDYCSEDKDSLGVLINKRKYLIPLDSGIVVDSAWAVKQ